MIQQERIQQLNAHFICSGDYVLYWMQASQREMIQTGKMHGYMTMYWKKKIITWTSSPQEAFQLTLRLNNKYELDGRNPNGYTGVA